MVQGVGYDQPYRSHFKSTENWLTASGGAMQNERSGWMARFLEDRYPGYNGTNSADYPNSSLGNQLKTIARMMAGGSRTKIYMASKGGWDNHNNMVQYNNNTEGTHANLLGDLSESVAAFQEDLQNMDLDNQVLTVIFSEFGRKIIQNGSRGTDHGPLSSIFLIGRGVDGGVIGNNINLSDQDNPGAPNPEQIQYDYRQVFSTVLQDWLGANDDSLSSTFKRQEYITNRPTFINESNLVPDSCYYTPQPPVTCACIRVRLFLEGFYDPQLQQMHTQVLDRNALPNTQPYTAAPFNYNGTETVTTSPEDTVDWVLTELRTANNLAHTVARKAFLLRADGQLMGTEGTAGIQSFHQRSAAGPKCCPTARGLQRL